MKEVYVCALVVVLIKSVCSNSLVKQICLKLVLEVKLMHFFGYHDTNSELINYIETLYIYIYIYIIIQNYVNLF